MMDENSGSDTLNQLPNELLSKIFVLSTPTPIQTPPPLQDSDLPWALLRVCNKWRNIALETVLLWNDVCVNYGSATATNKFEPADMIARTIAAEKILRRTKESVISLDIRTVGLYSIREAESRIFNLVISNSTRIKSLAFRIIHISLETFLQLEPISFPILENLSIDDGHAQGLIISSPEEPILGLTHDPYEVSVWKATPQLRGLTLSINIAWKHNYASLSWERLTYLFLRATRLPITEAHRILRTCPSLVALKITPGTVRVEVPEPGDSAPVHLPFLTELIVEFYPCDEISAFLRQLDVPSLRTLCILYPEYNFKEPDWNISVIPILAGFPKLRSLSFYNRVPVNDIHALLSRLPLLVELRLPHQTILSRRNLTEISEGTLLPNLEKLSCSTNPDLFKAHLEMVRERQKNTVNATTVSVKMNWYIDKEIGLRNDERTAMVENSQLVSELQMDGILKINSPSSIRK
ncbi:hypothetical protein BDZ94DRAFT_1272236 [Collybia nuda]|uniref:F-box domain-containing protein n=1 Tax=Collybia nuda TaxID=64659 RepID=A0A9P5XVY0_9AGAR|nr:hypothetical protein BDZ94DRAFT_1272236 [Collybia nuda]